MLLCKNSKLLTVFGDSLVRCFSSKNSKLLTVFGDSIVRCFSSKNGKLLTVFGDSLVRCFSSKNSKLLTVFGDSLVRCFSCRLLAVLNSLSLAITDTGMQRTRKNIWNMLGKILLFLARTLLPNKTCS